MSREQKGAWFTIAVFTGSLVAFMALVPFIGPIPALGAFGLMGLTGFVPLLFRKRGDPTGVDVDERDRLIQRQATLGGAMFSYMVFVLGCMGLWFYYAMWQGQQVVSVHFFAGITAAGGIALYVVRSIAILVLYGRE